GRVLHGLLVGLELGDDQVGVLPVPVLEDLRAEVSGRLARVLVVPFLPQGPQSVLLARGERDGLDELHSRLPSTKPAPRQRSNATVLTVERSNPYLAGAPDHTLWIELDPGRLQIHELVERVQALVPAKAGGLHAAERDRNVALFEAIHPDRPGSQRPRG